MGVRPSESRYMFEILLRHPDFVAINKPAGLCVHQDGAAETFTGLLAQQLGVARVWLLHRLDKPTGGVLLLALNPEAASVLAQQFAAHSMHKTYLALSSQKPAKKQGWVKGDMAKAPIAPEARAIMRLVQPDDSMIACASCVSTS